MRWAPERFQRGALDHHRDPLAQPLGLQSGEPIERPTSGQSAVSAMLFIEPPTDMPSAVGGSMAAPGPDRRVASILPMLEAEG